MNRQNILNFYGSRLELKLDSSELYDYELSKTKGDYDEEVLDLNTPIVYSTLIINTNLTDFSCNRTTITLTEYDNRVNNSNYPYSALTTTISYTGFTNFISSYHKRVILNNDVYIFEGITGEVHYMTITGYNNPLSFNPNMGSSSDEIINKFNNEYYKCTSKLTTVGSSACCSITPKLFSKPWTYQFLQPATNCTSPIIKQRTEKGWTLDFVFNRQSLPWSSGGIFYYYGVRGSTSTPELADNSLSFKFTSDGKIEYNAVRYSGNCNPSSGYSENYYTEVGVTPTLCTTGLTDNFNVTIVFDRYKHYQDCDIENEGGWNDLIIGPHPIPYTNIDVTAVTSTQITTGYLITNSLDVLTGATPNYQYVEELNKKWENESQKRLGVLKIYLNSNLIYKKENFEEVIASNRGIQPFIQSWGGLNIESGGVCCFNMKSIKYFEEPLNFPRVRHHYLTVIKPNFEIIECGVKCEDDLTEFITNGLLDENGDYIINEYDSKIIAF